jgi:hypothetical protein
MNGLVVIVALFTSSAAYASDHVRPHFATASSIDAGTVANGPVDSDRFSTSGAALWRGKPSEESWWWQVDFSEPHKIGALLQVQGDHPFARRHTPQSYVWQGSVDGYNWDTWEETKVNDERRTFRVHRLKTVRVVRWVRLLITSAEGSAPALREVEFYRDRDARISFPSWAVVVSTTGKREVPGEGGAAFRRLAQSCAGWAELQFQNVWLGDFETDFLAVEPKPICAFLSGNFVDWCQQDRSHWRGTADVLRRADLPIWASCGGMQGLAILADVGVDAPWDCPQCRELQNPRLPIYTHIAGSVRKACGDYSGCLFERGPYAIRPLMDDPVFKGLRNEFKVMESHCGQIEWAPKGWIQIATNGPAGKTKMQCLRLKDRPIYAAQFHIELEGTPGSSRIIMSNFLEEAQRWNKGATP